MIIAGIDEAGYGPLLGPLVVSATAFEMPGTVPVDQLPLHIGALPCCWKLLKAAVTKKSPMTKGRIIVADSKVVHHLADGVKHLERGVLAMLAACSEEQAFSAAQLVALLGCAVDDLAAHPWYAAYDPPIPWLCEQGDLAIVQNMVRGAMAQSGVRLRALRTKVVPEGAFNKMLEQTNNKGTALVSITLEHLYYLHTTFGTQGLVVGVDKQGGRDHYTSLLLRTFPEASLKVLEESDVGSSYLLTEQSGEELRRTVIHFREKGEGLFMPVALSSMICKYLRELYMHVFNAWWCQRIENLKPTAGYYQDGMRWLADVGPHLYRFNVTRADLARVR